MLFYLQLALLSFPHLHLDFDLIFLESLLSVLFDSPQSVFELQDYHSQFLFDLNYQHFSVPLLIVLLFLASLFQIQTLHYLAVLQHLPAFSLHLQIQYQLVFLHLQVFFLHPQFLLFHHQSYFVHLEVHLLLFAFAHHTLFEHRLAYSVQYLQQNYIWLVFFHQILLLYYLLLHQFFSGIHLYMFLNFLHHQQ